MKTTTAIFAFGLIFVIFISFLFSPHNILKVKKNGDDSVFAELAPDSSRYKDSLANVICKYAFLEIEATYALRKIPVTKFQIQLFKQKEDAKDRVNAREDRKKDSLLTAHSPVHFYNPTGTYIIGQLPEKNSDECSYFGSLKVKALNEKRIVVSFEMCNGVNPGCHVGTFYDTLYYKNKYSFYHDKFSSDNCEIIMRFTDSCVYIREKSDTPWSGCGFGVNVYASGCYFKTSSAVPSKKEMLSFF